MREPVVVVVLHSYQLLGAGLRRALPADRFDVRIITSGNVDRVFRSDLPRNAASIRRVSVDWSRDVPLELIPPGAEIVTNDEGCALACARLRAARNLPARLPHDLSAYCNKVTTKQRLRVAGVPAPDFVTLDLAGPAPERAADDIARRLALPLVVKPETGGYNEGVAIIDSRNQLESWLANHAGEAGWEAERFARGRLLHANALVADGGIVHVQVGAYTNAPIDSSNGQGLGSVTLPAQHPLYKLGISWNERVISALGRDGRFVVHTELFADDDGQVQVVDVAARAPGALVSDISAIHTGINLEAASFELQLGISPGKPTETGVFAGWLWSPPDEQGAFNSFLAWGSAFVPLVRDLERNAVGMSGGRRFPWLEALRSG